MKNRFVVAPVVLTALACGSALAQTQIDPTAPLGREVRVARDSAADRVVSVEYEGKYSFVRIETREPGAEMNQHPLNIDAAVLRTLLAALQLQGRKTEPLLTNAQLDEIAPPLAAALRKVKPEQDVTFAVSDRVGLIGPLAARTVTTARVFQRDGQLQVIAGFVQRDFESQFRATGYLMPFEPGSRTKPVEPTARIGVAAGAGSTKRSDWVALLASPPVGAQPAPAAAPAAGAAAAGATASGNPAAAAARPPTAGAASSAGAAAAGTATAAPTAAPTAPAPDADALYRNVSERLKALQRLRDTGVITEQEYQEKRRQILKDL